MSFFQKILILFVSQWIFAGPPVLSDLEKGDCPTCVPTLRPKLLAKYRGDWIEFGDPTRPLRYSLNGKDFFYRMDFSGAATIKALTLDDILRGGTMATDHKWFEFVEIILNNGRKLEDAAFAWDRYFFPSKNGPVGYSGIIPAFNAQHIPTMADNAARTRSVMEIKAHKDGNGFATETWTLKKSLFEKKPDTTGSFLNSHHAHSYGGRFFLNPDGSLWRDKRHRVWMIYERVTEEKPGHIPYRTEIKAIPMKNLKEAEGSTHEVSILDVNPEGINTLPFPATERGLDSQGRNRGYLIEGANPVFVTIESESFWVILFSSGNFGDAKYGTNLAYRRAEKGPIGLYTPLIKNGDLINLTLETSKKLDLYHGLARSDAFTDERGQWWLVAHCVPNSHMHGQRLPLIVPIKWELGPEHEPFFKTILSE